MRVPARAAPFNVGTVLTAAVTFMTPNPLVYWPRLFLVRATCGATLVIGFGRNVRLKIFVNSARIWRLYFSLTRKFQQGTTKLTWDTRNRLKSITTDAGFLALRVQVDVDVAEESGTQVRA
jgi:hypothetical protein